MIKWERLPASTVKVVTCLLAFVRWRWCRIGVFHSFSLECEYRFLFYIDIAFCKKTCSGLPNLLVVPTCTWSGNICTWSGNTYKGNVHYREQNSSLMNPWTCRKPSVFSVYGWYDTHNVVKQILKRLTFIVVQGQPKHCLVWLLRVFLLIPLFKALGNSWRKQSASWKLPRQLLVNIHPGWDSSPLMCSKHCLCLLLL